MQPENFIEKLHLIFNELCEMMELKPSEYPEIFFDETSSVRFDKYTLTDSKYELSEYDICEPDNILDCVGNYCPWQKKITIYTRSIREWASKTTLADAEEKLMFISALHQIGHSVTHLGEDENGKKWDGFITSPDAVKDFLRKLVHIFILKKIAI